MSSSKKIGFAFALLALVTFLLLSNGTKLPLQFSLSSPSQIPGRPQGVADSVPEQQPTKQEEEQKPLVRFVLLVGLEGTGHHFIRKWYEASDSYRRIAKWNIARDHILQLLYNHADENSALWSSKNHDNPHGNVILNNVVKELKSLDERVRQHANTTTTTNDNTTTTITLVGKVIHISGFMSYPNFDGPDRTLQYPDIIAYYHACEIANVSCHHVVMTRDPYEVILSTTKKRQFDRRPHHQMATLTTMLSVIYSQMTLFSSQFLSCWNYDANNDKEISNFGLAIGYDTAKDALEGFRALYDPPTTTHTTATTNTITTTNTTTTTTTTTTPNTTLVTMTEEEKQKIAPPSVELYMNSLVVMSDLVSQECQHQNEAREKGAQL